MLKVLGAVCLIFAGAAAGCLQSRKLREHRDRLQAFLKFLNEVKTEIAYAGVPVEEILERHGKNIDFLLPYFQARQNGEDFLQAWGKAAGSDLLLPQERTLLRNFGEGFGATDMQGQLSHCALYEELTHKELDTAEEIYKRKGKLYRMLGVCVGAIRALVLI